MTFDEVTGTAEEWLTEVLRRSLRQERRHCNLAVITQSNLNRIQAKRLDPVNGIKNLYLNKKPDTVLLAG